MLRSVGNHRASVWLCIFSFLLSLSPKPALATAKMVGITNVAAPSSRPAPAISIAPANPAAQAANTISGKAFLDYDADGFFNPAYSNARPAVDAGVAGVTVTAYDVNNNVVGTAVTTAPDGKYVMTVTGSAPYRVEFT
ncbi:MAG: hypothetical protein KDE50_18515, partial [Caldilineaceae bacterium]|nr:hypothetical protein [Caldilineaceae bacterium]